MKILAIRGENLASIAGRFEVRLDSGPLASAGLFAITGATGAGKSTLLDALCLALYDTTPRLDGRGGAIIGRHDDDEKLRLASNDVRSVLRRGTASGYAEVEFEGRGGQRFRARWSVRRARERADGAVQAQNVELWDLVTNEPIGRNKSEALDAIEKRLGLGFAQFRRSALLAQGDFAAFLRANAKERAELLEQMTGTELYRRISLAAHEADREAKKSVQVLEAELGQVRSLGDDERAALEASLAKARTDRVAIAERLERLTVLSRYFDADRTLREGLAGAESALAAAVEQNESAKPLRIEVAGVEAAIALAPLLEGAHSAGAAVERAAESRRKFEGELVTARDLLESAELRARGAEAERARAEAAREAAEPSLREAAALDAQISPAEARLADTAESLRAAGDAVAATSTAIDAAQAASAEVAAERGAVLDWLETEGIDPTVVERWGAIAAELSRHARAHTDAQRALAQSGALEAGRVAAETRLRELAGATEATAQALAESVAAREAAEAAARDAAFGEAERTARDAAQLGLERAKELEQVAREWAALQRELSARRTEAREATGEVDAASTRATELGAAATTLGADLEHAAKVARHARSIQDLSPRRVELRHGEPCPLCGALEHPLAAEQAPVDELVRSADEHERALRERLAALHDEQAKCEARAEAGRRIAERIGQEIAASSAKLDVLARRGSAACSALGLEPAGEPTAWAPCAEERAAVLLAELEVLRSRERSAELAEARARDLRLAAEATRAAHDAASREQADARETLERAHRACTEVRAQLDRAQSEMALSREAVSEALISVLGFAERLEAEPASLLADLEARVEQRREKQSLLTQLDARKRTHEAELERLRAVLGERERSAAQATLEHAEAERVWRSLCERRRALLGGRSVPEVLEELGSAVDRARALADESKALVTTSKAALASSEASLGAAQRTEVEAGEAHELARGALVAALRDAGIDAETLRARLEKRGEWLESSRAELRAVDDRLVESRGAVESQRRALEAHAANRRADLPEAELPEAELRAALVDAKTSFDGAAEQATLLSERLRADDEARARAQGMGEQLAQQRAAAERWAALNGLIGSSDGSNLPRFAQGLTLEAMLVHANHHLAELAPRYCLERVPKTDLDLQVIDRDMCDEVRSLQSLSGGESFLVSLALALGLSSLASRDVRVDTLFIDEGFGTLDPQTLETALAALDALQASGRQIGIISHVPGLASRIGAQVQVRKLGAGRSRVVVVGLGTHDEAVEERAEAAHGVSNAAVHDPPEAAGAGAEALSLTAPAAKPKRSRRRSGVS